MRTRAAVATQAGKPLEIMDVNLDGPRAGEVWSKSRQRESAILTNSHCQVLTPEGIFPAILGHEGAGVVVLEVGEGVTSLKTRRSRYSAVHARNAGTCDYCLHPVKRTSVPGKSEKLRDKGAHARRQQSRFTSLRWQ